jgi:hypothetical protein
MPLFSRFIPMLAAVIIAGPVAASEKSPVTADPNRQICKKTETTGSRIGAKRECKTKAEWDAEFVNTKNEMRRMDDMRAAASPSG